MKNPLLKLSARQMSLAIMKMLFLAFRDPLNPFCGGGDIYIAEIARGCAKRGHQVTFVSSSYQKSSKEENVNGIRVLRCGNGFTSFARILFLYFRRLRGRFDVVVEEIIGGQRVPFFSRLYVREPIVGIVQQRHKEIFRYQLPFALGLILSLIEPLFALLYRNRIIVVNSNRTLRDLRKIGFDEKRMRVVHPGIDDEFVSIPNRDISERTNQVICIAKARRYKLVHHAILAMRNVCEVLPASTLIIAGRSSDVDRVYEESLRKLADQLGLSGNVLFLKDISQTQKISLLSESKALVLPSAVEGFGIVVIEANACGTPAIVSDRIPEDVAIDGYNALVVQCGAIDVLSRKILKLITDSETWATMSRNAVEWSRQFSWTRTVDKFLENLDDISTI